MEPFPFQNAQELSRRFNEDEAVWRCFEEKRQLRRLFGSSSQIPDDELDQLDWLEAERETRVTLAIGEQIIES